MPILAILILSLLSPNALRADDDEAAVDAAAAQILERYFEATRSQQEYLKGHAMEAEFEAKVPSLNRASKLQALRYISKLGRITYRVLASQGDNGVKKEVIVRYIQQEMDDARKRGIGINHENYKFKYRGEIDNGWKLHLFELIPKEKRVGLFRGWLWVEAKNGSAVREQGEFVKSPSLWLRKITFLRDYEMRDKVSVPAKIETHIETRVVGPAELIIRFSNLQEAEPPAEPPTIATNEP